MEYIRLAPCKGTCYVFQGRNQAPRWSIKHDIEKEPGTDAHLVDKSLEQQHQLSDFQIQLAATVHDAMQR